MSEDPETYNVYIGPGPEQSAKDTAAGLAHAVERVSHQIAKGAPAPSIMPVLYAALTSDSGLLNTVAVDISPETHEALDELAYDYSLSVAEVVRRAIREFVRAEYRKRLKGKE